MPTDGNIQEVSKGSAQSTSCKRDHVRPSTGSRSVRLALEASKASEDFKSSENHIEGDGVKPEDENQEFSSHRVPASDTDSPGLETASSGGKPTPEDIRTHLSAEDATINSTATKHDAVTKATILKPSPSRPDGNYDIDALLIRRFDTPVYATDGSVEIVTTELPRLRYGILEKEKRFRRYFAECIQKPGGMDPFEAEALANQRVREEYGCEGLD